MSSGSASFARILLKGRPTDLQLADRLRDPGLEGLEFYLALEDIDRPDWLQHLLGTVAKHEVPATFDYVVEGPLRSLDGEFFDIARASEADREVVWRLTEFAREIEAAATVIHCISSRTSAAECTEDERRRSLDRALPFVRYYAATCRQAGVIPTLENIPPVARMREGGFYYSPIGVLPQDLLYFARRVEGLQVTLDVSHAQLTINAALHVDESAWPQVRLLLRHLRGMLGVVDILQFIQLLEADVLEAHISNAEGLLDEGLPYGRGDMDLDVVVRRLLPRLRFLVTETIEPDPDQAAHMREAQQRLVAVRRQLEQEGQRDQW